MVKTSNILCKIVVFHEQAFIRVGFISLSLFAVFHLYMHATFPNQGPDQRKEISFEHLLFSTGKYGQIIKIMAEVSANYRLLYYV